MKNFVLGALALGLVACSGSTPGTGGVEISDAYIVEPLKGRDVTAGYMVVQNKGADARLVAASSPIADRVEIHTHLHEGGVMKMRKLDGLDLPSGETVTFKPGSYHLMMFGVDLGNGTVEAPVTLEYASGDEVTLNVPVRAR